MDGHGGTLSSQWLQTHLFDAVAARVDASLLLEDPPEVTRPLTSDCDLSDPSDGHPTSDGNADKSDEAGGQEGRPRDMGSYEEVGGWGAPGGVSSSLGAGALLPGVRWPARARRVLSEVFHEVDGRLIEYLKCEVVGWGGGGEGEEGAERGVS